MWAITSRLSQASAEAIAYTYDALGRVTSVTYSTGETITYSYDAAGNRTQIVQLTAVAPSGSLSANPTSISSGASSTLSWTSANATSASIDNGVGAVTPVAGGSVAVSPAITTTYTLTLTGAGGTATRQAAVTVVPAGFNQTIAITGPGPVNLRALADAAGYNGAQAANVTFTIAPSVTVTGTAGDLGAAGGNAIDSGDWPVAGFSITLNLQVNGAVHGGGGSGGAGDTGPGSAGGHAINCRVPMTISVNSGAAVRGGGGGGGGGQQSPPPLGRFGGGGGGGGAPNGLGGAGGEGANINGQPGSPGSVSGGGAGGSPGGSGATAGGAGGAFATVGAPGSIVGGDAGYAVRKNGNAVTVVGAGTIVGTVG